MDIGPLRALAHLADKVGAKVKQFAGKLRSGRAVSILKKADPRAEAVWTKASQSKENTSKSLTESYRVTDHSSSSQKTSIQDASSSGLSASSYYSDLEQELDSLFRSLGPPPQEALPSLPEALPTLSQEEVTEKLWDKFLEIPQTTMNDLQAAAAKERIQQGVKIKADTGQKALVLVSHDGSVRILPYGKTLGKGSFAHAREADVGEALRTAKGKDWEGKKVSPERQQKVHQEFRAEQKLVNYLHEMHPSGKAPGIVKISNLITYTSGDKTKLGVLSHRYGDGTKLVEKWEQEKVPLQNRLAQCKPLFQGLTHMHKEEIIHGDIKDANILFDENGPVLADLGGSVGLNTNQELYRKPFGEITYSPLFSPLKEKSFFATTEDRLYTLAARDDVHALGVTILGFLDGKDKELDSCNSTAALYTNLGERLNALPPGGIKDLLASMIISSDQKFDEEIDKMARRKPMITAGDALAQLNQILSK